MPCLGIKKKKNSTLKWTPKVASDLQSENVLLRTLIFPVPNPYFPNLFRFLSAIVLKILSLLKVKFELRSSTPFR